LTRAAGTDFERDADGLLVRLDQLAGYEKAGLVLDLLTHAHAQEWPQFNERINVLTDDAVIVPEAKVEAAMLSSDNGESFVTFDEPEDIDNFFDNHSMADWMLFLHPEQKRVAERDFKGPARLRGISGSGKTSVLVHRARYLAKKYQQPVLMVTLTESMRKLLDHLSDDLCGVERHLLLTTTMSALARNVVNDLKAQSSVPYRPASSDQIDAIYSSAIQRLKQHKDFSRAPFHSMEAEELSTFIRDEIYYVRCRLRSKDLHLYLDSHSFQRRGRGLGLSEIAREIILDAIKFFEDRLITEAQLDHEGVVAEALGLIETKGQQFNRPRCILCDEVQDLSHLELARLASIPTPDGASIAQAENGLFLAGDGAQTIYKRGFTLRHLGIDIVNRSFTLKKSYRNTSEILTAAFGLVSQYEFADVDEENVVRPSAPEFAKRHGQRLLILRCSSLSEEARVVAQAVLDQVNNGTVPGQVCIVGPTERVREEVHAALTRVGIAYSDLRQDADYESVRVKVSTIESAKGHEFGTVFVMGLVEGLLPNSNATGADIEREAARLYVAMTRARDALTLSYSLTGIYTSPSRFLLAIQKDCDEAAVRGGQLRRLTGS
jgi:superfamily I DNA/RNA helicase